MMGVVHLLQVVDAALPLLFVALYLVLTPSWYRYQEARYMIESNAAFALLLGLGAATALFGSRWLDWAGRDYVRLVVYLLLAAVFVKQLYLFFKARRRVYQRRNGGSDSDDQHHQA